MNIKLITTDQRDFLLNAYNSNRSLFLQNTGYEYINPSELTDEDKDVIEGITSILKNGITGFSKFNNFRVDKEDNPQIRVQYNYCDPGDGYFIGVGYILIDELLNGFTEK